MTKRQAMILLAALISVRASAYLFSKLLLLEMGTFTLLALRFLIAFALLAIIFHKHFRNLDRRTFLSGLAMGAAFFATMACELAALTFTSSCNVSFLENTAIVMVPLGEALIMRAASNRRAVVCALAALAGVGLLTLGNGFSSFGPGEVLALAAAVFYAIAMIVTAVVATKGDTLLMGIMQVGWIGAFGVIAAFAFETPVLPSGPLQWGYLAYLVIVCTGFGFTLQPMAQAHLKAEDASMMCALNPLVAAVLGILVLGELVGLQGFLGMALILAAIVLKNVSLSPKNLNSHSISRASSDSPR